MDFMTFVTAPQNLAFMIAGVLVAALFIIELVGTVVGFSLSHIGPDLHIDVTVDANGNGIPDYLEGDASLMGWLNPGGVPLMIFITLFLVWFSILGYSIQDIWSDGIQHWLPGYGTGPLLPGLVAAPLTGMLTLFVIRPWTRLINRILPKEESSDVTIASLQGSMGVVTIGPVTKTNFGFIRVRDKFGTDHAIQVAASNDEVFAIGADVQMVGPHPTNQYAYLIR